MPKIEGKNNNYEVHTCYNCGFQFTDLKIKSCPNCHVILNPNTYIKWKRSWYGFLCCLCVFPFVVIFLVNFFL